MNQLSNSEFTDLVQAYDESHRHSVGLWAVASQAYALGYRAHEKKIESYPLGQQVVEERVLRAQAEKECSDRFEELRELRSKLDWANVVIRSQEAEIKKLDAKRTDPAEEARS